MERKKKLLLRKAFVVSFNNYINQHRQPFTETFFLSSRADSRNFYNQSSHFLQQKHTQEIAAKIKNKLITHRQNGWISGNACLAIFSGYKVQNFNTKLKCCSNFYNMNNALL